MLKALPIRLKVVAESLQSDKIVVLTIRINDNEFKILFFEQVHHALFSEVYWVN